MKKCPICQTKIVDGALFCHMCGISLKDAQEKLQHSMREGKIPLYRHTFQASGEQKVLEVWCHDITSFPQHFDLLTISSYYNSYNTYSKSVIGALWRNMQLNVGDFAIDPYIDLRSLIGCWISKEMPESTAARHFTRIGCISFYGKNSQEKNILGSLKSYFHMLDLAADTDISMETVALPLIGTGVQGIQADQILLPLMNEVVSLMKRNEKVKKVIFVDHNWDKANMTAEALRRSYQLSYNTQEETKESNKKKDPYFFLSYTTHGDTYAAELFRDTLKKRGIRCWYAPDDIHTGDYASQIVNAIRRCTHFVCIISKNTATSFHVVNELDLAFNRLSEGITILPFMLDDNAPTDSFFYYISRMQWNYGFPSPIQDRIVEFLDNILK